MDSVRVKFRFCLYLIRVEVSRPIHGFEITNGPESVYRRIKLFYCIFCPSITSLCDTKSLSFMIATSTSYSNKISMLDNHSTADRIHTKVDLFKKNGEQNALLIVMFLYQQRSTINSARSVLLRWVGHVRSAASKNVPSSRRVAHCSSTRYVPVQTLSHRTMCCVTQVSILWFPTRFNVDYSFIYG